MSLALFDLDHTLLDGDSNSLWLEYLVACGHLAPAVHARQADYMARYAAQKLDIVAYLEFHLGLLSERPLVEWLPVRNAFVRMEIAPRISQAARATVAGHRQLGHRLAIITATHSFLSSAIGTLLDMPVIAPQPAVIDGFLSGRIEGEVCFREKKLQCLDTWLASRKLSDTPFPERHFYSDSANDLPLLEQVSHPVAVNPDPQLAALAAARGWPLETWRCG